MREIHLRPPRGWINDPNGFIYYKGEYHLFYQHFPYAPRWGRMHWGHAVSRNLTDWKHLVIALFPTKTDDCDGCFSGSAVEKDGKMHILYTGVRYDTPDPENTNCCIDDKFTAAQLHISSEDGYTFDNFNGKKTAIPPLSDPNIGDRNHTRDPKIWKGNDGNYYAVLGSTAHGKGRLLFYRSKDLLDWEFVNYASKDGLGWMWECPDLFKVGDEYVLIFSPMGTELGNQAFCGKVTFDEKTCSMNTDGNFALLDIGKDLYAPQSTVDRDGRRTVIAWLRMPKPAKNGTIGMFCTPRVCEIKNGHIRFTPHPDVRNLFTKKVSEPKGAYMLKATLDEGESLSVGGYDLEMKNRRLTADRSAVIGKNTELETRFETPELPAAAELEIFVDENMIEVFVNGGEYVITNTVYGLSDKIIGNAEIFIPCETEE